MLKSAVVLLVIMQIWSLVLVVLWGLLDVVQSRYENIATRLMQLATLTLLLVGSFELAVLLTPPLLWLSDVHSFDFIPFYVFRDKPVLYATPVLLPLVAALFVVVQHRKRRNK